jgi:hypothetical protein
MFNDVWYPGLIKKVVRLHGLLCSRFSMDILKGDLTLKFLTPEIDCDQMKSLPPVTFAVFLIAVILVKC